MATAAPPYQYVGKSVIRREGADKVTGRAVYVDDRVVSGAIHGKTIRSSIACGKIKKVVFEPGIPWDEFTIVDARDVPDNIVTLIEMDQPVLADGVIRHKEEPILLLAHPSRELLEKAVRAVTITYESQSGIFDIGKGPVQKEIGTGCGDVDAEFAKCDIVLERTFRTGAQEHVYIEPNGIIAWWDEDGLTVRGSLQCPYYVHKALKGTFHLDEDRIDVIHDTTGGGFGGKEEFPSIVALHAALLAKKAGKPVRMIYDRHEDLVCSTKRHPSRSVVKIGAMKDGRVRALDFDFMIDGGAYVTLSPVVLSRGVLHAFGPYVWQAARIRGRSFMTNSPPYGAFRGFGAPQSFFAIEAMMSLLADELGMDPAEVRRKNFLHKGDKMPTGQVMQVEPNLDALLDRALEMSDWKKKRAACKKGAMRGLGISTFMHGAGFTGAGEVYLASKAAVATREDGKAEVRIANTEIGQGTETIFAQFAAEAMQLPIDQIAFRVPQTRAVPNSGPTVASRTCMVVGRLIEKAARQLKEQLGGTTIAEHFAKHGPTVVVEQYVPPPGIFFDDKTYQGSAYGTYAWACNVAEASVDPVTYQPKVENFYATVDIGTVINPVLAAGQVEGGIAQGVGWATCEEVVLREGVMANCQMTNYIIPTTVDAPQIEVEFIPSPYPEGAFGAKGVGELPMDGPAPASSAAIGHAIGREILEIPIKPEAILP